MEGEGQAFHVCGVYISVTPCRYILYMYTYVLDWYVLVQALILLEVARQKVCMSAHLSKVQRAVLQLLYPCCLCMTMSGIYTYMNMYLVYIEQ